MKSLSTSTILMLIASSLIFFFVGRYSVSMNNSSSVASTAGNEELTSKGTATVTKDDKSTSLDDEAAKKTSEEKAAADAKEKADAEANADEAKKAVVEIEKEVVPIDKPRNPVVIGELPRVKMGISDNKIGSVLSSISENLEAKRLAYISTQMQDCSGIFHQLKDSIQQRLPSLAQTGGSFEYPSPSEARSSRQIADWYYKKNNLIIVEDAMASRNSIRPGSVMFYGKSGKKFSDINIDMLTDRNNNFTSNGAIQHIAVVTEVKTDENQNVIEYTIMHGRNKRVHASRSGSKAVQSLRTKGLPPFGNWKQQLVAIANITTHK